MNLKAIFILLLIVSFCSCKKKYTKASFHGRVTYECDGTPVQGAELNIQEVWNASSNSSSYLVGTTMTDANGNFWLSADVKVVENFNYYKLNLTGNINPKPFYFISEGPSAKYESQDEDISLDLVMPASQRIYLHIKNVTPYDHYDKIYSVHQRNGSLYFTLSPDLAGMNVDTVIEGMGRTDLPFLFEYAVFKNMNTIHVTDSAVLSCYSDSLNLFY